MKIVNSSALEEFRAQGLCEWCKRPSRRREASHTFAKGMGGAFQIDHWLNLTGICFLCHANHHCGRPPTQWDLIRTVAEREGLDPFDVRYCLHALRAAPPNANAEEIIRAILGTTFARRSVSGLVDCGEGVYLPPVAGEPSGE